MKLYESTDPKENFIIGTIFFASFVVLTICLKFIDVAPIGPEGSEVGLAYINDCFRALFTGSTLCDVLADFLLIITMLSCAALSFLWVMSLLKTRSIFKIDPHLSALIIVYVLLVIFYAVGYSLVINYGPVLSGGNLKTSYPSSHVLACTTAAICNATFLRYHINRPTKLWFGIVIGFYGIGFLAPFLRIFSGIHWFTDVLGAVLLSTAFIYIYKSIFNRG